MAVEPATAPRTDKSLRFTEALGGRPPYRIEKLKGEFARGELAKRYNIILEVDDLPYKTITMPMWCKKDMTVKDVHNYLAQDYKKDSFLLLSGLLASPDQFAWEELSFIENLMITMGIKTDNPDYDPIFLGMAAPGFDGSEITKDRRSKISPSHVSIETYEKTLAQAERKLKLGKEVAEIGHSAGGAVVLLHRSRTKEMDRKVVAIDPAINIDEATQFMFVKFLLGVVPLLEYADKPFKTHLAETLTKDVVRFLNGYMPEFKNLGAMLRFLAETDFEQLPPQVQKQVNLHVDEILTHLNAAIAKTLDLQRRNPRSEETRKGALIITGTDDIITFAEDIIAEYGLANVRPGYHHNDVLTNPFAQNEFVTIIVNYLITGKMPSIMNEVPEPRNKKMKAFLRFIGNFILRHDGSFKRSNIAKKTVN